MGMGRGVGGIPGRIDKSDHNGQIGVMKIETVGTLEAKTRLSEILQDVQEGVCYRITKHGKPVAELRPISDKPRKLKAGFAKGAFTYVADDFDAPLDDFTEYTG